MASALRATFFNVGYTISVNAVILLMTVNVPYSLITSMISSINLTCLLDKTSPTCLAERTTFAGGLHFVYLVLVVVNTLAIIPSLLRGRRVTHLTEAAETTVGAPLIEVE